MKNERLDIIKEREGPKNIWNTPIPSPHLFLSQNNKNLRDLE